MQVLQLCHKIPQPARDGGTLAMQQVTDLLLGYGWDIKVFAIATRKHPPIWSEIPSEYIEKTAFECSWIDTRFNPLKALYSLFTGASYNVIRYYNKSFAANLRSLLSRSRFDLILLEGLYLTPYIDDIKRYSKAKIILRAHNIEHQIWERRAGAESNPVTKAALSYLAITMQKYEALAARQCDGILSITPLVHEFFAKNHFNGLCEYLPFFAHTVIQRTEKNDLPKGKIFHLGAMDWKPNLDGLLWFLNNVWPEVLAEDSSAVFHVAGKNIPDWLAKKQWPQVVFEGEVSDAEAYARDKSIMVVPLLSGSGLRIKIIEGLAWGKTIITTPIGAEGTGCAHNVHLLIANNAREMATQIIECLRDSKKANFLARTGNSFVAENYNPVLIAQKLKTYCEKVVFDA